MKCYVIRHVDAGETIEDDLAADEARPITAEGAATAKRLATWMAENDEIPTVIYAAPDVRAMQTAKILQKELGLPRVKPEAGLNDDAAHSMRPVMKRMAAAGEKRVALVSHHAAIISGLRALNEMKIPEIDPYAKGELRILKVDRDTGEWEEKKIVRPSDLGGEDDY